VIIWGIDIGIHGALTMFDVSNGVLEIHDMPIVERNGKKLVSGHLVANILRTHHGTVWIERVGARPGQGVSSMFSFGRSAGIVEGVAIALDMPINLVTPQAWQRKCLVQSGKDGSRSRAMEIFPAYSQSFARKSDDGRSDSALIAYYGLTYGENVESNDQHK
jgi:crossover junction endodeoxyribonuclease RuvC